MATTKITNPELFDLGSLNTALQLPSGTTAERPTSPSTGEWRYNTDNNLIEFYDGGAWRELQDEEIPPVPSENFNTVLYTGNNSTQSITGVGFQPDFVWAKVRSAGGYNHNIYDSSRGALNRVIPNTDTQGQDSNGKLSSFDSDGFSLIAGGDVNPSSQTVAAWCWKVNGGTTSSNTDGTITSTVQANPKTGISIIQYTGNGVSGATVGHGLSSAPEMLWSRKLSGSGAWGVYNKYNVGSGNPAGQRLKLDTTDATLTTNDYWAGVQPTSTVFSIGTENAVNASSATYVMYAFHSVAGFSKLGSYTGAAPANGPIINTGFEPAFILLKNATAVYEWVMYDNKRNTSNPRDNVLYPNTNGAENSGEQGPINFFSNGFQVVGNQGSVNQNGGTIIYMAFAADPSPAPALADSFNIATYIGNSRTQNITGLGFSPSLVWIKSKNISGANHNIYDSVRGAGKVVLSNTTNAEVTTTEMTGFSSDGFDFTGTAFDSNNIGNNLVAWNWKANSIPTINTDGSVTTVVSANQAAGFSIVKLTTGGPNTYGHGLSQAPEFIFAKILTVTSDWYVYNKYLNGGVNPAHYIMKLNTTDAEGFNGSSGGSIWNSTEPTSTVFSTGTSIGNAVVYCFHSVPGFSKIGSYTGNGSATGPVVTTGFQPDYLMIKRTDVSGYGWYIWDSVRSASNPRTLFLAANSANAEGNIANTVDFNANDFQLKNTDPAWNQSGGTYIYMAFKNNITPEVIPAGEMAFLVVAGGGGGGYYAGGGGGAGGLRTSYGTVSGGGSTAESNITLAAGTYTITVGAGGASSVFQTTNNHGANGSNSSITGSASISSVGGGGGAGSQQSLAGLAGGSGGGANFYNGPNPAAGGAGTVNQGFAGATITNTDGGGGGGAAGAGGAYGNPSNGGPGLALTIEGYTTAYAGGGGGWNNGAGGYGGGGNNGTGNSGAVNTGGGAGGDSGGGASPAGGGSGIVILRLLTSEYSGTTTGSPAVKTVGDYTILKYTGSGTYVHS